MEDDVTGHGLYFDPGYFASMYRADPDPWAFDTSWYERRKFALTLAALPKPRYRNAVEAGCANGALTELLATRCDQLTAFEFMSDVAAVATRRLSSREHVAVVEAEFPIYWPAGPGDLVVWSEVAYYLTPDGADVAARGLEKWLEPLGHVVAVHYSGETNYPRTALEVASWLDELDFIERVVDHHDRGFHLGVWERRA